LHGLVHGLGFPGKRGKKSPGRFVINVKVYAGDWVVSVTRGTCAQAKCRRTTRLPAQIGPGRLGRVA